ncbi:MAG: hypothetical protein ACREO9_04730, partial [Lysobacterales bacterium]
MIKLVNLYLGFTARVGAAEFLYELMKERDPQINISHSTLPSWPEHHRFVHSRPYRFWYLIEQHPEGREEFDWIGFVSATWRNELGIVLRTHYRGKGFGPAALSLFMQQHEPLPAQP